MEELKSLDSLFKEKIFRIPDFQRGYAWQQEQLKDFWEDLINLSDKGSHYTGVLTLKQKCSRKIDPSDKEYWLVEDHSYKLYYIIDGQQRLTTFIIFIQTFIDFVKDLQENENKIEDSIYITDTLSLASIQKRYLFKTNPRGDQFRTYKFGYETDDPSYDYIRYKILGEKGAGKIQETFYTLNLENAKKYFHKQFEELHKQEGLIGLQSVYKKLTKQFLFNEYIIKNEFDIFVAFETMNNRGKKLSDLELLKNRLIYLTTLYGEQGLDSANIKSLRETINEAWKEVYFQLGRNKMQPLNDDDFLRAHWIMYFKYSRQTARDYIQFLLDEQFTPQKVRNKFEQKIDIESVPKEQDSAIDFEDSEDENENAEEDTISTASSSKLEPKEISDFVKSLKESVVHWFHSFYPDLAEDMSREEQQWIDRLNRIGMIYFRPLIMAILKNETNEEERIDIFKRIERFIFIAFRMMAWRTNYGSSVFYNAAREIDRDDISCDAIKKKLNERLSSAFNEDRTLKIDDFYTSLRKKFENDGEGYYNWFGLKYFLFEYELNLLSESRQKKVDWSDLQKTEKDKISIEHIYPQTETYEWEEVFKGIDRKQSYYKTTLGNLLLLSAAINSSLQNDSFEEKKKVKYDNKNKKVRNGYSDGSHSEIEVSQQPSWGPQQIYDRGMRLLEFMENRWEFRFKDDDEKKKVLFLDKKSPP